MSKIIKISMVVAVSQNRVIGKDNDMPWRLSTDLKRFKTLTLGKPVIMGRKTWDSIGRPLPGRLNVVITRNADFAPEGATVVHSLEAAIDVAKKQLQETDIDEICIIGGGNIYRQALPMADMVYLTHVLADIEGDTDFPELDPAEWQEVSSEDVPAGEKDNYPTHFCVYQRKNAV
ncbi:dihydrofolate reductase [Paenochrobactrum sp. BZR 588]|uniref:dihydrofolate reductase n=1 Tax=Paenochrobactrum TaxID=999488 RepID=UPI0035BC73C1